MNLLRIGNRRRLPEPPVDWNRNPVADTPPELEALARSWLTVRDRITTDEYWALRRALVAALETTYRNKYHRAGDLLVGLFDCLDGRDRIDVQPALCRLY